MSHRTGFVLSIRCSDFLPPTDESVSPIGWSASYERVAALSVAVKVKDDTLVIGGDATLGCKIVGDMYQSSSFKWYRAEAPEKELTDKEKYVTDRENGTLTIKNAGRRRRRVDSTTNHQERGVWGGRGDPQPFQQVNITDLPGNERTVELQKPQKVDSVNPFLRVRHKKGRLKYRITKPVCGSSRCASCRHLHSRNGFRLLPPSTLPSNARDCLMTAVVWRLQAVGQIADSVATKKCDSLSLMALVFKQSGCVCDKWSKLE